MRKGGRVASPHPCPSSTYRYNAWTVEDFFETVTDWVASLPGLGMEAVEAALCRDGGDGNGDYVITVLRFATSYQLQVTPDDYLPFILGAGLGDSVQAYAQSQGMSGPSLPPRPGSQCLPRSLGHAWASREGEVGLRRRETERLTNSRRDTTHTHAHTHTRTHTQVSTM